MAEHGTTTLYRKGCRCPDCREAQRLAVAEYRARHPRQKKPPRLIPLTHGIVNGYQRGCRCEECRIAKRQLDAAQRAKPVTDHGTPTGYARGCRCLDCRTARQTYVQDWGQRNPDKVSLYRARFVEKAGPRDRFWPGCEMEIIYRDVLWARDGGICHICQEPVDRTAWHIDHIVPLSKGGHHLYTNVAVSHPRCNMSKGDRLLVSGQISPA